MRRLLFVLVALVACSGQMCGDTSGTDTGATNVCGRTYYNETFRIGLNPPVDEAPATGDAVDGLVLNEVWTWDAVSPAIEFKLMVVGATTETTLAEFRDGWLAGLAEDETITVTGDNYVTLDNGQQGWLLVLTKSDNPGKVSKSMMTVTNGQLAYLRVVYPETVTAEQLATIDGVLDSLCSDSQ
jgi:hypothetical protein